MLKNPGDQLRQHREGSQHGLALSGHTAGPILDLLQGPARLNFRPVRFGIVARPLVHLLQDEPGEVHVDAIVFSEISAYLEINKRLMSSVEMDATKRWAPTLSRSES